LEYGLESSVIVWVEWCRIPGFLILGILTLADLRREPRPDGLHWLGLGLALALQLLAVIVLLVDVYYWPDGLPTID
jgi:hypothetical protein